MARPRVAAGVLIHDGAGRVLLVRPTYKQGWDIPGGYVEPDETPLAACARELQEEINLSRPPGRALVVDWAPHPTEGDKLLFVFDGGTMTDREVSALVVDGDEIAEARFHPASELPGLMPARLARRLALALDAVSSGATIYAENGVQTHTSLGAA
jgi:8-oxo-dGTP pyrophosphatase MutT (NUDIX family)